MTIEWCEKDPTVVLDGADGRKVPIHVVVAVEAHNKHLLDRWHGSRGVVADGLGGIAVTGPECTFRAWGEDRRGKPARTFGDAYALRDAGETVTILVDL